jgi:hypothetical protein
LLEVEIILINMWHILGDRRGAYRVMVGRPDGKRPLERPRHRREDNIKIYVQAVWKVFLTEIYYYI